MKQTKAVAKVKLAWENIASDLTDLHGRLLKRAETDLNTGDLDFTGLDLDTAQLEWNRLADEAAGYIQFQMIPADVGNTTVAKTSIDEAMKGFVVKKAA